MVKVKMGGIFRVEAASEAVRWRARVVKLKIGGFFWVEAASEALCWRATTVKVKIGGFFGSRLHLTQILRQCVGELGR